MVEQSNRNTTASVAERKAALESLVTTIDLRTTDLDQRLSRFTGLLDELLAAAEERARDIARVVAETAGAGSAAISRPVRGGARQAAEEERRLTSEAMSELYQQSTQEADAMFKQSAEKFATMVTSMKQMAAEMHQRARGHAQRASPRRAGNAAGSRRKHLADAQGDRRPDRGSGGTEPDRRPSRPRPRRRHHQSRASMQREEEPMLATAGGRGEQPRSAPRMRETGSASTLPPPDLGMPASRRTEAPPVSPASADQGRDGWLSDLLSRTDAGWRQPTATPRAAVRRSSRRRQSAGVAVARHRPADGPQPRRRDVGSLPARREQGVHQAALHARPARRRSTKSPANTAPTATSSRPSTATSPSSSACSTRSRATNAAPPCCAATSPRRPASSTPCSRMRRDGWGKALADRTKLKTEAAMPPFCFWRP